jgi:hypothetical protein
MTRACRDVVLVVRNHFTANGAVKTLPGVTPSNSSLAIEARPVALVATSTACV